MNTEFYKNELLKILAEMELIGPVVQEEDPVKKILAEVESLKKLAYLRGKKDGLKIYHLEMGR